MKPMTIVFVLVLVLLQYRLWSGNGSLVEVNELKQQIAQIEEENKQLQERNQSLAAEVLDLKSNAALTGFFPFTSLSKNLRKLTTDCGTGSLLKYLPHQHFPVLRSTEIVGKRQVEIFHSVIDWRVEQIGYVRSARHFISINF